jgi:hypothetical protein
MRNRKMTANADRYYPRSLLVWTAFLCSLTVVFVSLLDLYTVQTSLVAGIDTASPTTYILPLLPTIPGLTVIPLWYSSAYRDLRSGLTASVLVIGELLLTVYFAVMALLSVDFVTREVTAVALYWGEIFAVTNHTYTVAVVLVCASSIGLIIDLTLRRRTLARVHYVSIALIPPLVAGLVATIANHYEAPAFVLGQQLPLLFLLSTLSMAVGYLLRTGTLDDRHAS